MDSRVNDCFGWDLKKCGSRKNCLGWQEAIATLSVQLDHGKLTPQNKSPGPKICSCNLLMDWVLHLVVCCTGVADQGKLVQNTRICMWSVNKLCSTASAKPIWLWKTTQLYLMATIGKGRVWSAWATNKSNKSNISICGSDYSKYGYIRVSIHGRLLMGLIKLWKRRWCKKRREYIMFGWWDITCLIFKFDLIYKFKKKKKIWRGVAGVS